MKYGLGWIKQKKDERDFLLSLEKTTLPESVDLRPGFPYYPVDQKSLGCCTSCGITAAVSFDQKKQGLTVFAGSRLFLYYNERDMEGTTDSDAGAEIRDGFKTLNSVGLCTESLWPYIEADFKNKPNPACYEDALSHRSVQYSSVSQDLESMKQTLYSGNVLVLGISVYSSFMSEEVAQTGVIPLPQEGETLEGGHCVCICGYDDSKQSFILRNSWGTSWGCDFGYAWVPYSYLTNPDLCSDLWVVTVMEKSG